MAITFVLMHGACLVLGFPTPAEPSLQVLEAGVKELFKDPRIFVMHSDALEQIQDGVTLLTEYGDKALTGLK